jgi:hypothetical protein
MRPLLLCGTLAEVHGGVRLRRCVRMNVSGSKLSPVSSVHVYVDVRVTRRRGNAFEDFDLRFKTFAVVC